MRPRPVTNLDPRLQGVLHLIRADRHADIGSDHARLPLALVQSGRCKWVVAVELNPGPLEVARQNVQRAGSSQHIDVRQGDGFGPLAAGEVQSASITGMGSNTILSILQRAAWLPPALVLQPNAQAQALRHWAYQHGYHLRDERLLPGFWNYTALRLERASHPIPFGDPSPASHSGPVADPAYQGLPLAAALRWGPHLLRARHPLLRQELLRQQRRLQGLLVHQRPEVLNEWAQVNAALRWLDEPSVFSV